MIAQNIARLLTLAAMITPMVYGCAPTPPASTPAVIIAPATPPPGKELCPGTTGRTYC